jgi:hypothetical protein
MLTLAKGHQSISLDLGTMEAKEKINQRSIKIRRMEIKYYSTVLVMMISKYIIDVSKQYFNSNCTKVLNIYQLACKPRIFSS